AMREKSILHLGARAYSGAQVTAWARLSRDVVGTRRRLEDGRQVWVAEARDGAMLGFIDLEDDGHIDFLYVAPEAAGQGVAQALYEEVEARAVAHQLTRLYTEASELARPFFERQKFSVLTRQDLEIDGVPIHNYRMAKLM
ncbi:MAG: GNAT family N-acetyltransferase, partial [Pseudomonadota bacterium]